MNSNHGTSYKHLTLVIPSEDAPVMSPHIFTNVILSEDAPVMNYFANVILSEDALADRRAPLLGAAGCHRASESKDPYGCERTRATDPSPIILSEMAAINL
jgi:hypothetical protein